MCIHFYQNQFANIGMRISVKNKFEIQFFNQQQKESEILSRITQMTRGIPQNTFRSYSTYNLIFVPVAKNDGQNFEQPRARAWVCSHNSPTQQFSSPTQQCLGAKNRLHLDWNEARIDELCSGVGTISIRKEKTSRGLNFQDWKHTSRTKYKPSFVC